MSWLYLKVCVRWPQSELGWNFNNYFISIGIITFNDPWMVTFAESLVVFCGQIFISHVICLSLSLTHTLALSVGGHLLCFKSLEEKKNESTVLKFCLCKLWPLVKFGWLSVDHHQLNVPWRIINYYQQIYRLIEMISSRQCEVKLVFDLLTTWDF